MTARLALALMMAGGGCQPAVEAQVAPASARPAAVGPAETSPAPAQGPAPAPAPVPRRVDRLVVTTSGLRLRVGPSTASAITLLLVEGEEVVVLNEGSADRIGGRAAPWYRVETADGAQGWAFGAHLSPSAGGVEVEAATARAVASRRRSWISPVDTERLPRLLERRGYKPPASLKALVIAVERTASGDLRFHRYDLHGTSRDRNDWWPASSVKTFAAVAALERLRSFGMGPSAEVTFHYDDGPVRVAARDLVRRAVGPSDNRAFDRLVEVVGSRRLNGDFFSERNGLADTLLLRSYTHRHRHPVSGEGSSRQSPRITLREGSTRRDLPPQRDAEHYADRRCPGIDRQSRPRTEPDVEGNCTTLIDLTEVLRRVVLHDELPPLERFDLGAAELELLRTTLASRRSRGMNIVDGLTRAFGARPVQTWSKPGYALKWFSDAVFVRLPDTGEEYLVGIANRPGRAACDEAAGHMGALLAAGHFRPGEQR